MLERLTGEPRFRRLLPLLALCADLALFVLVVRYAMQIDAGRPFTFEHDLYHQRGEACLRHGDCPLAGSVLQGPGYVYLLALCRLFTADPAAEHWLTLGLLGGAAVLSARLIHARYGWPWGWAAAVVIASDVNLLHAYRDGQHAPFITFPLAALAWGAVHWINGRGGRYLVFATAAAAFALHFHGIALLALPGLLVAALLYRPPTSRRALNAAIAAPLVIQCTTVFEALRTRALPGSLHSTSALHTFLTNQSGGASAAQLSLPTAAIVAAAVVLAVAAVGPARVRHEPRSAAMLLAFFAGPCAAYLATRHSYLWLPRYLLVFEPALGLLVAATLGTVAGWAARAPKRWRLPLSLVTWGAALLVALSTLRHTADARSSLTALPDKLTYREQIQIARASTRHGIPPARWLSATHGASWWSEGIGPRSIGKTFAAGRAGSQHALLVDRCARVSPRFAAWQQLITNAAPRVLAGYDPQLRPVEMNLSLPDGSVWSSPHFSRILPGRCGFESETLTQISQPLRGGVGQRRFEDLWMDSPAGTLRLRAVLEQGAGDRVIAVQHGSFCHPAVRIGGGARAPQPDPQASARTVFNLTAGPHDVERYLVPAREHEAGPVEVEVTLERNPPPGAEGPRDQVRFFELDVFEEPWPTCESPR